MHEMGAFTDMLLSNKGSREEAAKLEGSEEGESLPGTSRHREYYPEGIADILKVKQIFLWNFLLYRTVFLLHSECWGFAVFISA